MWPGTAVLWLARPGTRAHSLSQRQGEGEGWSSKEIRCYYKKKAKGGTGEQEYWTAALCTPRVCQALGRAPCTLVTVVDYQGRLLSLF